MFYKLDHLNSVKTLNSFNPLDFKNVNRNTGLFLDYKSIEHGLTLNDRFQFDDECQLVKVQFRCFNQPK